MDRSAERQPFTVSALFELADGRRYEIYDGGVYMVPPPSLGHQYTSGQLHFVLMRHIQAHGLGRLFAAPVGLILDETNYVEPDLIFVASGRESVLTPRGVEGVPDLVVEILSPSTHKRDLGLKTRLYEQFGVPHCWIVDPDAKRLSALTRQAGQYVTAIERGEDETFEPTLFPGLSIEIAPLFEVFS